MRSCVWDACFLLPFWPCCDGLCAHLQHLWLIHAIATTVQVRTVRHHSYFSSTWLRSHGTDPSWTPSGDGAGSSERSSANGVQRTARHLCMDHHSHFKFGFTPRLETEALTTAIRWKPFWQRWGYAAVLSQDGQGGALLREGCQAVEVWRRHDRNFGEKLQGCPPIECSHGSCFDHVHPRRSGNAGKEDSQLWAPEMDFKLGTQSRNGSKVVEQAASMARLISPKRTKNVNELQVAVMQ